MLLRKDKSIDDKAGAVVAKLLDAGEPFATSPVALPPVALPPVAVPSPARPAVPEPTPAGTKAPRHHFSVNAQTLSFGYQKYFPAFEALSFALDDRGNLSTALLFDPALTNAAAFSSAPILQSVPAQPAICVILPISWASASGLAGKVDTTTTEPAAKTLLDQAQGPIGTCWYADSSMHAPVFATSLKDSARVTDAGLKSLKDWALRRSDAAALLHADTLIVFSPDKSAADRVLAVNDRRLASLADNIGPVGDQGMIFAFITPNSLASLIKNETIKSLSAETEPHLRAAAQRHLWPRLDELARMPAFKVSLAADALQGPRGWRPLLWQNLGGR